MPTSSPHLLALDPRLDWFLNAKFGLFLHWGAYSVGGVEASWPIMTPDLAEVMFKNPTRISQSEYERLPQRFNPVKFDAKAWVRMAQDAGMRYIMFTSKHHDGFCMFEAPGTDYKITNTPFRRDICLELANACHAAGMRLGFYYSPPDMHHPGYRDTSKPVPSNWLGEPKRPQWADYLDYMESHLRKLLTDYGEISVIWFDGLVGYNKYDPQRMQRVVRELSPNTLINDRLGWQFDYITPEQFIPKQGIPVRAGKPPAQEKGGEGLFKAVPALLKTPLIGAWLRKQLDRYADGTLELTKVPQEPAPAPEAFQPWETCMTMGTTWAFNPVESRWKTPEALVRNLVEVASRGGNLLLNVGPTPEGTFPPEAVERLRFIASWMERNQEAIHGTTYAPPLGWAGGRATRRGDALYLHLFDQPADGSLVIDAFSGKAKDAAWQNGARLPFTQVEARLEITLQPPPESMVPVIRVEMEAA